MALSLGIVGLPNVGKSTLFKALTRKAVDVANYPFCTIDPNIGVVTVPDPRLAALAGLAKPEKIIPTAIEFYDIAGLVKNAHKGEGLGNQFLSHIKATDAIIHLFRAFEDKNVTHVSGAVDPVSDIETIELELVLADLAVVSRKLEEAKRQAKSGNKDLIYRRDALQKYFTTLEASGPARAVALTPDEVGAVRDVELITTKPVLYVGNVSEDMIGKPLPASLNRSPLMSICAKIEAEIAELDPSEVKEYLAGLGIPESGLAHLIRESYRLLDLITFFTAGPEEVRAWTVRGGDTAPVAAGKIHTDFQKNFIRAEVTSYQDYIASGSEAAAKERGLMRVEGKEYVMQDGDVVFFRVGN